jgi:dolichol-phosphate mannosyltransferase
MIAMGDFLSVVVPCYNESEVVEAFHRELSPILESLRPLQYELIFVDDGSADDTLDRLNRIAERDPSVRVCSLSRNFGHQIALTAGLEAAVGDAVIMMDSDLQHPPAVVPELVRRWREGFDVVSAVRQRTEGATLFKDSTSRGFYFLLNRLSSTKVPQGAADFCLVTRRVALALRAMPEHHRFLRGLISWAGFRRTTVPYVSPRRAAGVTKYSPVKMMILASDAIFSFSAEPLRLALRAGLTITFLGFAYLAWNLVKGFVLHTLVPGYASLIGVVTILGGCQLVFIGLIGEYLARVFEEVKRRPVYLLKQEPKAPARPAPRRVEADQRPG